MSMSLNPIEERLYLEANSRSPLPPNQIVSNLVERRAGSQVSNSSQQSLNSRLVVVQSKLSLPEGEYIGQSEEDEPHGEGTLTYKPGMTPKKYVGAWKQGQFCGRGILTLTDGGRYEGEFERGWPHGSGFAFFADGSKFQGKFRCGYPHGKGTAYKRNGEIEEGEWFNGYKVLNEICLGSKKEYEILKD